MDEPDYAYNTFIKHYGSVDFTNKGNGFVMLELGPGDSIASGIIARCFGAKKSFLVDKGNDAIVSAKSYATLFNYLKDKFDAIDVIDSSVSMNEITKEWSIVYLIDGLDSLKKLPDYSVDYLWSQSVLEHIRKSDFFEYIKEFRRIISDNGVCVHGIDLKDHLSYSHNNLRFSETVWESEFMANSGFYTNRVLFTEMMNVFNQNGFEPKAINVKRWDNLPTPRSKLDVSFRGLNDDDLMISEFDVILRPV